MLSHLCSRTQDEVKRLVAGQQPGVFICNNCVELCAELLDEEKTSTKSIVLASEAKLLDDIRERQAKHQRRHGKQTDCQPSDLRRKKRLTGSFALPEHAGLIPARERDLGSVVGCVVMGIPDRLVDTIPAEWLPLRIDPHAFHIPQDDFIPGVAGYVQSLGA